MIKRNLSSQAAWRTIAAAVAAGLGFFALQATQAASFVINTEAETGAITGSAGPGPNADASGGASILFGTGGNPSPTPQPPGGACTGAANTVPGSPDPWGGCWPGPQNTGYPKGLPGDSRTPVALSNYTGPMTISTCGTIIDAKTVDGDLTIVAGNGTHSSATPCVTVSNSLIKGTIHTDTVNQGPVVITDTEVAVPGSAWWASVGFYNTYAWRVNSHGGHGTLKCQAYCGYYDSWIHSFYLQQGAHHNAIGSNGIEAGDEVWMNQHNYLQCGDFIGRDATLGDAGCSADFGLYGDFGPIKNVTVNRNFFAAALQPTAQYPSDTQSGYCLQTNIGTQKPYPVVTNLKVTGNVFAKGYSGKCGTFGPESGWSGGNGNIWSGNVWDDGSPLDR